MINALLSNQTENDPWTVEEGRKAVRFQSLSQFTQGPSWKREAMRGYSDHLLIWVTRGQGRVILGGHRSGYTSHNAIFVPAGTMLKLENGGQCYGTVVHISPAMHIGLPQTPVHLRIRNAMDQCELTNHLEVLQKELDSRKLRSQRAAVCLLGLISVWLERQAEQSDPATRQINADDLQLVRSYTASVETQYASGKGIGEYAAELGTDAAELSSVCKRLCDMTASEILNHRLHYAARDALAHTGDSVQRVAEELGFSSTAFFSRAFETVTGESPQQFRDRAHAA